MKTEPTSYLYRLRLSDDESIPDNQRYITFHGKKLAHVSSKHETGKRSRHWTEYTLYKDMQGGYLAYHVARSNLPGEVSFYRIAKAENGTEAIEKLAVQSGRSQGKVPDMALSLLKMAEHEDSELRDHMMNHPPSAMLPGDETDGEEFILFGSGIPMRFYGNRIASSSSRKPQNHHITSYVWLDIDIYNAHHGGALRWVIHRQKYRLNQARPEKSTTTVTYSPNEVLECFKRTGQSWIDRTSLDALYQAVDNDDILDLEIGSKLQDYELHNVGLESLTKKERIILNLLVAGHRIVSTNEKPYRKRGWDSNQVKTYIGRNEFRSLVRWHRIERMPDSYTKNGKHNDQVPRDIYWTISADGKLDLQKKEPIHLQKQKVQPEISEGDIDEFFSF